MDQTISSFNGSTGSVKSSGGQTQESDWCSSSVSKQKAQTKFWTTNLISIQICTREQPMTIPLSFWILCKTRVKPDKCWSQRSTKMAKLRGWSSSLNISLTRSLWTTTRPSSLAWEVEFSSSRVIPQDTTNNSMATISQICRNGRSFGMLTTRHFSIMDCSMLLGRRTWLRQQSNVHQNPSRKLV